MPSGQTGERSCAGASVMQSTVTHEVAVVVMEAQVMARSECGSQIDGRSETKQIEDK